MVATYAPRARAAATCRAVFGWLATLAAHMSTSLLCALMSSFVLASRAPVSASPYAPSPQQIIVPDHHCAPLRLARRRVKYHDTRVP